MYVTKPYVFLWFGDIHGPKTGEFIGSRATTISHTPVLHRPCVGGGSLRPARRRLCAASSSLVVALSFYVSSLFACCPCSCFLAPLVLSLSFSAAVFGNSAAFRRGMSVGGGKFALSAKSRPDANKETPVTELCCDLTRGSLVRVGLSAEGGGGKPKL
jgi:hypothetical protein